MKSFGGKKSQKGMALAISVIAALVVSLTASVVMNLTFRRYYLSFFERDHLQAFYGAEAGYQYALARLRTDQPFYGRVLAAAPGDYVVGPQPAGTPVPLDNYATPPGQTGPPFTVTEQDAQLGGG